MKTWLANLHWTKRLLFGVIALTFPWVSIIADLTDHYYGEESDAGDLSILFILTALVVYWVCKPFIAQSSAGDH
jgi:hypothetical protein